MQSGKPFRDLLALHNRLSRLFEDENHDLGMKDPSLSGSWSPPLDMFETPQAIVITMELPGLTEQDVQVTVEGNQLIIRGERPFPEAFGRDQVHRIERAYGSFKRSFPLPDKVTTQAISAIQENGVLTITLPRKTGAGPRRIEVIGTE